MRKSSLLIGFVIILFVVSTLFLTNKPVANNTHRIMLKYGRQIPTAPIAFTIAWHLKNGD